MSTSTATELTILSVLRDYAAPLPFERLFVEGNGQSVVPISRTDLHELLSRLEKAGDIFNLGTRDTAKLQISAQGRARLAEANL